VASKTGAFGSGAHAAGFDFHVWRKIALADGDEVFAVEGAMGFDGDFLRMARHQIAAVPERSGRVD